MQVGNDCRIYITEFGSEPFLIEIGDRVTITSGVRILTHEGSTWLIRDNDGRRYLFKKVIIGSDVFIGVNAIIMPGVIIGNNVIIGAGSIVTKSIPSGTIVAGNRAQIIGNYEEYEKRVLNNCVSESQIDNSIVFRERIFKILDNDSRLYLERKI